MKKFFSIGLVVTFVMSLVAGCGTPSSASKTQFFIGGIGPITGGAAIYGQAVKNGAQLAIDEVNAGGGINGYKVTYDFQDDENDAEKTLNAYNNLKDKGMQILMGTVTSTPCVAVADKTINDKIFQITPSGSSVDCIKNGQAYQVCFTDPNQGAASAKYITDNKIATKVAVIYDSSDVYSSGIYTSFAAKAKSLGVQIVSAEAFTADNKTDFSVQLQKAKSAGADLVFLPIYYTEASLILSQANSMSYAPKFFGCDGLDGILGVKNFNIKLAESVMLLTPFAADATDSKTQSFVTKYKTTYGETPNQFAADAYDAIYIIKAAIEKANVKPSDKTADICAAMKNVMTEIKVDGLTGSAMTWLSTGEVNKDPKAVIIKDGVYKAY